jgi:hypothetical protein
MTKRLTVIGLSVFALAGLFAAPAANAAPSVCISLHANINGTPVDRDICLPPA